MKGQSSTSSLRRRGSMGRRGVACAWLLACLPAVGACHKSSPSTTTPHPDGSTTNVTVTDGSVRVTVTGDDCPAVIATAGPAITRVGSTVFVGTRATDDDPGDQLTYKWTAAAGSFANPTATNTTYTCPGASQAGPQVLTVTVSDGRCSVMRTVTVSCDALIADAGSDASTDAGTAGTSGGAGGAGGRGGSGAGGVGGSGAGGTAGACAGNDPTRCEGEVCNQCTFGVPEGATDLCDDNPEGCYNCDPAVAGCDQLTSDADRTKCLTLYVCIRDNHCVGVFGAPLPCYCGTADPTGCLDGTVPPNGPCIKQFSDAAKTTSPKEINTHLTDNTLPIGAAVNLVQCRAQFCGRTNHDPSLPPYPNPSCPLW
jgi:hypothetical protein